MAYCEVDVVRKRINADIDNPPDNVIQDWINKADLEIDALCGGDARTFSESINFQGKRIISTTHDFISIDSILIDGKEYFEFESKSIIPDGTVEEGTDSTPEYWTANASGSDTLTWDNNESFTLDKSLKIEKGSADNSYWESDTISVNSRIDYLASAYVKPDANTTGNIYLKLIYYNSSNEVVKTYTSAAVTQQIVQASTTSTIDISSSSEDDNASTVLIDGLVNGIRETEAVEVSRTYISTSTKSFSHIYGVRVEGNINGTISIREHGVTDTDLTTLDKNNLSRSEWTKVQIAGSSTSDSASMTIQFYVASTVATGSCYADNFELNRRNFKPLYSQRSIELQMTCRDLAQINVNYKRSMLDKLVGEISKDLASLFILTRYFGSHETVNNYNDMEYQFNNGGTASPRAQSIMMTLKQNRAKLLSHDSSNTDAYMGESTF